MRSSLSSCLGCLRVCRGLQLRQILWEDLRVARQLQKFKPEDQVNITSFIKECSTFNRKERDAELRRTFDLIDVTKTGEINQVKSPCTSPPPIPCPVALHALCRRRNPWITCADTTMGACVHASV